MKLWQYKVKFEAPNPDDDYMRRKLFKTKGLFSTEDDISAVDASDLFKKNLDEERGYGEPVDIRELEITAVPHLK